MNEQNDLQKINRNATELRVTTSLMQKHLALLLDQPRSTGGRFF